jgi:hypothetical protein
MTFHTARERGYTVQRTLAIGSEATLTADCYHGRPLPAGTRVRVLSYTNAGFRGIEAVVAIGGGERAIINAGFLRAVTT